MNDLQTEHALKNFNKKKNTPIRNEPQKSRVDSTHR